MSASVRLHNEKSICQHFCSLNTANIHQRTLYHTSFSISSLVIILERHNHTRICQVILHDLVSHEPTNHIVGIVSNIVCVDCVYEKEEGVNIHCFVNCNTIRNLCHQFSKGAFDIKRNYQQSLRNWLEMHGSQHLILQVKLVLTLCHEKV